MTVENLIKQNKELVEAKLKEFFENKDADYKALTDAMEYSLFIGGKRLRPLLILEFATLCGGKKSDAINFACALEMIHTYSLIHDDLPCMDNDDLRRGKPSCHKAFSEDTALLAGDALLTYAFEIASANSEYNIKNTLKSINVLAKYAGINGMIGGQVIDLAIEGKTVSEKTLRKMCMLKTGALLKAAAEIGCIIGGGNDEQIKSASKYAENLGLAFQIEDDVLDVVGNEETLGKPIGSDADNNKTTYVSLYGLDKAKELVEDLTNSAIDALKVFNENTENLIALAEYLKNRDY